MRLLRQLLFVLGATLVLKEEALGAAVARDENGLDVLNSLDDAESGPDVPAHYLLHPQPDPESNPHPPDHLQAISDFAANHPDAKRVVREASKEGSPQQAATAKPSPETEEEDLDDRIGANIREADVSVSGFDENKEYEQDVQEIDSDIFHRDFWPPKKPDGGGAEYAQTPQGLKEWKADRKKVFGTWDKYVKLIKDKQQDLEDYVDSVPRPYPYCVTGLIPNYCPPASIGTKNPSDEPTDRDCVKFTYTNETKSDGPEKDDTQLPIHNNWYPISIFDKDDGRFRPIDDFLKMEQEKTDKKLQMVRDPHLERYYRLLRSQPLDGMIEQLRENGEAPDVTETRKTSYLHKVEFRAITVNEKGRDGLSWPNAQEPSSLTNGATVDDQMLGWTHIIVSAKEPLQGVFIQAISYPMGLPFGEFRDDFECNAGGGIPNVVDGNSEAERHSRRRIEGFKKLSVLPCRYSHGNNNGDAHPTVYAFGGSKLTSTAETEPNEESAFEDWNYGWGKKTVFRTHFRWSNTHCNLKMRVQFIIMAVKNFEALKFEVFRTVTYVLQLTHGAGTPPPYMQDWTYDCRIGNVIKVDSSDMLNVHDKNKVLATALYVLPSSKFNILYDSSYDRCIQHYHGYGHFGNTPQCKATKVDNPDCPEGSDTCSTTKWICDPDNYFEDPDDPGKKFEPLPETVPGGVKPYQVFTPKLTVPIGYPPVGVCPPADICLNGLHKEENSDLDSIGFRSVRSHFDYYRDRNVEHCEFPACTRPKEPRPIGWGEDAKQTGDGVDFGRAFHEVFDSRNSALFRRLRGEHVWTLTLSWFVLMFVGNFVGRYYKETAGIHIDGTNSILGLGWWIWVHIILLLVSATFMWIGILVVMKIKRLEPGCNQLEKFEEFTLKNYCRQRRRIVRYHQNAGYFALCLYLLAFFAAWRRPNKSYLIKRPFRVRFNERKFYFWMHIIFAYASKIMAVICVMILLWVETEGICKDVPILVLVLEVFSIGFFITGHVIQLMEDKASGIDRSKIIPEAIDANVTTKWYTWKFRLVIVACAVHYLMLLLIAFIGFFIYNRNGEGYDSKEPRFEIIRGFLHWGCNVTNKQAEVDIYIDRFPFSSSVSKTD